MATKINKTTKEPRGTKQEDRRGNGHNGKKPIKMFEVRLNFNLKNIIIGLLIIFVVFHFLEV